MAAYEPVPYTDFDKQRRYPEQEKPGDERNPFERDRNRIIHSFPFRRLQGKTQVLSPEAGDFHRTRLTHSLEVAQIGKGLALRLGAHPDLVEAIALAHDLGHPPFGHAGEEALNEKMQEFGGFEGNAQTLRVLTRLEPKITDEASTNYGLNLTRATIDGVLKYKDSFATVKPREADPAQQKFYYDEDHEIVQWATCRDVTHSIDLEIMDWADDVAYAVHDLEDAIHLGFLLESDVKSDEFTVAIVERAEGPLRTKYGITDEHLILEEWEGLRQRLASSLSHARHSLEYRVARKRLTSELIGEFVQAPTREPRSAISHFDAQTARHSYRIDIPQRSRARQQLLYAIDWEKMIENRVGVLAKHRCRKIIQRIWCALVARQADQPGAMAGEHFLGEYQQTLLRQADTERDKVRVLCDYVSGMTDEYARRFYVWLTGERAGWSPGDLP